MNRIYFFNLACSQKILERTLFIKHREVVSTVDARQLFINTNATELSPLIDTP